MSLFRRNEIVDLTETIIPTRKNIERKKETNSNNELSSNSESNSVIDFMSGENQAGLNKSDEQKLDISDIQIILKNSNQRIEDHSHELYKLLHRVELLEKKIERLEGRGSI